MSGASSGILDRLYATILERRNGDPASSYTAKLFAEGPARIAKKLGEEGVEAAIAGALGDPKALAEESADLIFHLLVLWARLGVRPADVYEILSAREGRSGLDEKRARHSGE
jgi:phosphoribosyl-ATP pyrophosphohydrolase